MDYDLVVVGAGVTGVATAYWARRAGLKVAVVERQSGAALETSFANGGQVSVSHAEPWANPGAPLKVLKWLSDPQAPLLFRPRLDYWQWRWIAKFLGECTPAAAKRNTVRIVQLGTYSRDALQAIRAQEKLEYSQRQLGILHFYRDQAEYESAVPVAALMREYGCDRQVLSADEVLKLEPAFKDSVKDIVGATYTPADESGDAKVFSQQLANVCEANGVEFLWNTEITRMQETTGGDSVGSIDVIKEGRHAKVTARNFAVCLGSYSAPFLRPYGIKLDIYPAKGYSVTIPTNGVHNCPIVSLTDDEFKLVYSNLGTHLRVAGTAELSGYSRTLNYVRCKAIVDNVRKTFPNAGDFDAAQFWTGLRPATPSNVPYIGRSRLDNLWLNTGHGTLGWTMAAGSGQLLVNQMTEQEVPEWWGRPRYH
jgi:D-amino-acid dehydrogenase